MNHMRRVVTASAAAALTVTALLIPATAQAAPQQAATATNSTCAVTGGDLKWGVKESFRSYISGTIANGNWEVSDGASYETPLFGWSDATGEIDAETGEGTVSFVGTLHFSGHEGVLNLVLKNPTIELNGDGTGRLLLDAKSNNAQGELVIDEAQVYIGKIEGIGQTDPASGTLSFEQASAVLTGEGAAAFGGFYASGDDLDPVALSVQLGPCSGTAAEVTTPEVTTMTEEPKSELPIVPIIIGGVAVVIIAVAAGLLIAGRKKSPSSSNENETGTSSEG